jgi:hypothetical protein
MKTIKPWLLAIVAGLLVAVPYAIGFVRYYTQTLGYYPSCMLVSSIFVVLSFLVTFVMAYIAVTGDLFR